MKGRAEEPAFEPVLGRASDLVPLEDNIDPHYPAQRIIISRCSSRCTGGRRSVCDRHRENNASIKNNSIRQNCENERIRGELQRLDVILKNLDD
ncbi:hypothetical protein TELCIR_26162 [Teladorsagia circumcincta]|uniref:Uncharacterized protein n=1 Tax=Teladorsagia circumcincta TaxID=45464 RepID=A0A2G9T4S4_TELCI|nr:hypothetical protein TELCIR_26162 [Teladorsagia circumcincta]